MISLRLSEKGILVVFLTLILQLSFVLALALSLRDAHDELQRERNVREIIAELNRLSGFVDDCTIGLTQELTSPDPPESPEFYKFYGQYLTAIPKQMDLLLTLTRNSRRNDDMKELASTIYEGVPAVEKFRKAHLERNSQRDYLALALKDISLTRTRQMNQLMEEFAFDQKNEVEAETRAYNNVLVFLGAGVLANIIIAIILMIVFTRALTRKVDHIRDNVVRLSAGVPLLPPLAGSDELGLLDESFHKMAGTLAESIRREQALISNAVDVIFSLDRKITCLDVNEAARGTLGMAPEDLIGRHFIDLVEPQDRDKTVDFLQRAIEQKQPAQFENRLKTKTGETIDVTWSVHWSDLDQALFCVVHDISQRKQVERLKRDFVAMIGHDLRAPLTSVQLILSSALEGIQEKIPPATADRLGMAKTSIERLIGLVNGLMSLEKLDSGEVELSVAGVRASEVVIPALHSVEGLASRRPVQISLSNTDNPYFYCDKEQLIQVLVNLLSNAIKFSPALGVITLTVAKEPQSILFQVKDQGRGVPKEMQEKIFERFKQVKKSDATEMQGTGLGLSICKSIVERHGGAIGVESQEGAGSTFWFRIPLPGDDDDDDQ